MHKKIFFCAQKKIFLHKKIFSVILDQTVCYPQGGGQPSDTGGIITNGDSSFHISDVRMDRNTNCIHHIGQFSGQSFSAGDLVTVKIDENQRLLYSRIHSAGHLIDACLNVLGYNWKAGKGYHFPDGPFVEYVGEVENSEVESIKTKLEEKAKEFIAEDVPVIIDLDVSQEKAKEMCGGELDPMYLKAPTLRLISIGHYFTGPCGGTHVQSLNQLKGVQIPKIKVNRGKKLIKVNYRVID